MTDRTSPTLPLVPINKPEFAVGSPTPRPVYDRHGKLLLASGVIIETQHQLNGLVDQGYELQNTEYTLNKENQPELADSRISHMDDVRWYVGEPLHMYSQTPDDAKSRFIVRLIGYVKGKSVLVTAPFVNGKYVQIQDGHAFVIRVFQGKKAYSFTVTALKSVYSPHPYLHLSYPKQITSSIIRTDERAKINLVASVTFNNPTREETTTLTDMSINGASGIIRHALAEKKESGTITFKINITGYDELLSAVVTVRSVEPLEDGSGYRYGFEFQNLPPQYKIILSAYIHQQAMTPLNNYQQNLSEPAHC